MGAVTRCINGSVWCMQTGNYKYLAVLQCETGSDVSYNYNNFIDNYSSIKF